MDGGEHANPEELLTLLMNALIRRVKDAESAGAIGALIIFDFHGADPFSFEDVSGNPPHIPALMLSGSSGDAIKEQMDENGQVEIAFFERIDNLPEKVFLSLSFLSLFFLILFSLLFTFFFTLPMVFLQICIAIKNGVKAIMVGQSIQREKPERLLPNTQVFTEILGSESAFDIPCVMLSHESSVSLHYLNFNPREISSLSLINFIYLF